MGRVFCLMVLLVLCLSGCSDTAELLSPPQVTDDQAALNNELNRSVHGQSVSLKYPSRGDYLSAFVLFDREVRLDRDDTAIVFYELEGTTASGGNLWLALMERDQMGQWHALHNIPAPTGVTGVDFVTFAPMENADYVDIIIGWSFVQVDNKSLSVYSVEGGMLTSRYMSGYTDYLVADANLDGLSELYIFLTAGGDSKVRLVRRRTENIVVAAEYVFSDTHTGYRHIQYGNLTESLGALFVDYYLDPGVMNTAILQVYVPRGDLSGESTITPIWPENLGFYGSFIRDREAAVCEVIDGKVAIPVVSPMPGYTGEESDNSLWVTDYMGIAEHGGLTVVMTAINNQKVGYRLALPGYWVNPRALDVDYEFEAGVEPATVTELRVIARETETDELVFYEFRGDRESSFNGPELLKIKVVSVQDYQDRFESEGYELIASKGLIRYYAYIPDHEIETSPLDISFDEVLNGFTLL